MEDQGGPNVEEGSDRYLFLCGADMDPTAVRAAYPGARFVARARVASDALGSSEPSEVWGILLRVPGGSGAGESEPGGRVTTDDGRSFEARLVAGGRPTGEPAAILAWARYWELPPAYVDRLLGAVPSEVVGDA